MTDDLSPVFDDPQAFDLERAKLARRRKIAEDLIASKADAPRMMGDWVLNTGPMGGVAAAVNRGLGNYENAQIDDQEKLLGSNEARTTRRLMDDIPAAPGRARTEAQANAMRYPSIRDSIKAQMIGDEAEAKRIETGEQAALNRVEKAEEAERNRIEKGEQAAADRVAREDLRRIPSQSIHVSVGNARAGDGKPLSPAQEKSALELGSNRSNLQMLTDTFKDEYSGDIRSTVERKFGEAAGGLAPQSTQDMQRWWANQAMFDELPQRHEMFGATLTAGEKASWNAATINPNMAPKMIRERLAIRSKIYDDAQERMRASAVEGGRSGKQFDAAVGKPRPTPKAVVREVKLKDGRTGVEYSDGTRGYK